jgi:radical SAM superfamily enzyme
VDVLERIPAGVAVQRFTGDATGALLVAPEWCRNKAEIGNAMAAEFRRRGSRQGSLLETPAPPAAKPFGDHVDEGEEIRSHAATRS